MDRQMMSKWINMPKLGKYRNFLNPTAMYGKAEEMSWKYVYNTSILGVLHYIDDEIGEFHKICKILFSGAKSAPNTKYCAFRIYMYTICAVGELSSCLGEFYVFR